MTHLRPFVIAALVACSAAIAAQANSELAGTWTIDRGGAPGGRGAGGISGIPIANTMIIKPSPNDVTMETDTGSGQSMQTFVYKLDGSANSVPGALGWETKATAVWQGANLVVMTRRSMTGPTGPMGVEVKDVYSVGQAHSEPEAGIRQDMDAAPNALGDFDLQGNFTNKYEQGTPFERPNEFAGRRIEDLKTDELKDILQERQARALLSITLAGGDPAGNLGGPLWWQDQFEVNTLVVETTNFRDESVYRNGNPATLKLIERFTRTAPNRVEWAVTVDDPATWTRPWTFAMPLTMNDEERIMEYACHEGNRAMDNILCAARAEEEAVRKGLRSSTSPVPTAAEGER